MAADKSNERSSCSCDAMRQSRWTLPPRLVIIMTEICLKLDDILLSYIGERMTLAVTSLARFQVPRTAVAQLASAELLEGLKAGKIWVSRGNGCCLDFKISLEDIPLTRTCGEGLLETLAQSIRDAPLWSQLPLSPTLDLPDQDLQDTLSLPGFSIKLARSLPCSNSISSSVSSESADPLLPSNFPHVYLIKVEVFLSFCAAATKSGNPPKRRNVLATPIFPVSSYLREEKQAQVPERRITTTGGSSPKQHLDELLNAGQWLSQASLMTKKAALSIGELYDEESFSCTADMPDISSLLPNTVSHHQLLGPQTSDQGLELKRKAADTILSNSQDCVCDEDWGSLKLDSRIAQKMVDLSLACLIGGRQTKSQQTLKVSKPYPDICLSEIARPLWSPGFGHDISQRSQFLSSISSALSKSLARNSQSPILQLKLKSLLVQPTSNPTQVQRDVGAEDIEQIRSAVQLQLFRMMQLSLYDPMAGRRLLIPPEASYDRALKSTTDGPEMIFDFDACSENETFLDGDFHRFDTTPCRAVYNDENSDLHFRQDDDDFDDLLRSGDDDIFDSLLEANVKEISARSQAYDTCWTDWTPRQGPFAVRSMRDREGIGVRTGSDDVMWDSGEEQEEFNNLLALESEGGQALRQRENRDVYGGKESCSSFEDILGDWFSDGEQQVCIENENMLV